MPSRDLSRWRQTPTGEWERNIGVPSTGVDATEGALEAAADLGIDITTVQGSGKDGRITKADVEAAAGPSD